jgi:hypothetical protein
MIRKTISLTVLLAASIALGPITAGAPLQGPLPAPTTEPTATPTARPEGFDVNPGGVVVFSLPLSCIIGLLILAGLAVVAPLAPRILRASSTAELSDEDSSDDPEF